MNLLPFIVSWAVLATVVLCLAIYRSVVARKEDDYIHVEGGQAVSQQTTVAKKLEVIDRWGKGLTILAFVYALAILGLFLYSGWTESTKLQ